MTTLATTERCRLEAVSEQDEDLLVALNTNEEVRRYLGGPTTAKAARRHLSHMLVNPMRHGMTIIQSHSDKKIGIIDFYRHHDGEHLEISYMVLPQFWGMGLAREALTAALQHRFSNDGSLEQVVAETQTANIPSCRLLGRLGFREIQRLHRFDAQQTLYSKPR